MLTLLFDRKKKQKPMTNCVVRVSDSRLYRLGRKWEAPPDAS